MAARALVGAVIGFRGAIVAILLEAVTAIAAFAARIDEDFDAHHVARLEFVRPAADRFDAPDYLVTGHARIERAAPDIARAVEIRVADPAILDLDPYVAQTRFPALECDRPQRRLGGGRGITEALEHGIAPVSDIASEWSAGGALPLVVFAARRCRPRGDQADGLVRRPRSTSFSILALRRESSRASQPSCGSSLRYWFFS